MKRASSSRAKNKYLALRDAAVISGYTVAELRNLIKAGLLPARKRSGRLCIPSNAFTSVNKQSTHTVSSKKIMKIKHKPITMTALALPSVISLVPFVTAPDARLLKVLQPTALAAALVMTLHIGLTPVYAERIIGTVDMAAETLAVMGAGTTSLLNQAVAVPVQVATGASEVAITALAPVVNLSRSTAGEVAGATTVQGTVGASIPAAVTETETYSSAVEGALIGIADASDNLQRFLDELRAKTLQVLVYNNTFDKWDQAVSQFRW